MVASAPTLSLVVGMEQEAIKLVEVIQGDREVEVAGGKA